MGEEPEEIEELMERDELIQKLRKEVRTVSIRTTGFARLLRHFYEDGASLEEIDSRLKDTSIMDFMGNFREWLNETLEKITYFIEILEGPSMSEDEAIKRGERIYGEEEDE